MEEEVQHYEKESSIGVNEENLLLRIWTQPVSTFTYILNYCPDKHIHLLLVLGGIVRAIDRASVTSMGDKSSTVGVLFAAVIGGGLFGWMTYYFYAWIVSFTGRWINGKADARTIRVILAWSSIPAITSLILLIPEILIYGNDLFRSDRSNENLLQTICEPVFSVIQIMLSVWSLALSVIGVALVQKFSSGKAILNILLGAVILVLPFVVIGILMALFRG